MPQVGMTEYTIEETTIDGEKTSVRDQYIKADSANEAVIKYCKEHHDWTTIRGLQLNVEDYDHIGAEFFFNREEIEDFMTGN